MKDIQKPVNAILGQAENAAKADLIDEIMKHLSDCTVAFQAVIMDYLKGLKNQINSDFQRSETEFKSWYDSLPECH